MNDQRRKKKPRSLDDAAKAAARRFSRLKSCVIKEPKGFASGSTDNLLKDDESNDENKK